MAEYTIHQHHGGIRRVTVPDRFVVYADRQGGDALLDMIYAWGQERVQPLGLPPLQPGDTIVLPDKRRFTIVRVDTDAKTGEESPVFARE